LAGVRKRYGNSGEFLLLMAEAQLADNQPARAKETGEQLVQVAPNSATSYFMQSKIYAANNDRKRTYASLKKALEIDPRFLSARLAMVKMLAFDKKIEQAKNLLRELIQEYPEDPKVLGLEGWVALRTDEPKRAINVFKKALDKYPSTDMVIELVKAQWAFGEKDKALNTLADWSEKHPGDSRATYFGSQLYSALGESEKALKLLEKIVLANPNNVLVLNDLAWILRKRDANKALEYVEKALEITPKAIPILDTYAMVLVEKGQFWRAESLINQIISKASENQVFKYHLAVIQEKSGQIEKARETLRKVLASKKAFSEKAEAEALFRKLSGGSS